MTTVRRFLRPAIGLAILIAVLLAVDVSAVLERLGDADPVLAALGIAGLVAVHLVGAGTWRLLLRELVDVDLPWRPAVALYYGAQAIGGLTPANVGGDLHRIVAVRAAGHGPRAAVAPVAVQRATSLLGLGILAVIGLTALAGHAPAAVPFVAIGLAFAVVLAGLVGALVIGRVGPAVARLPVVRLLGVEIGPDESPIAPTRRAVHAGANGLALGVAFHAIAVGCSWLLIAAVGPATPVMPILAALAVARLSLAVPITPSGIGIQEGALAILFVQLGLSPEAALAGTLLGRVSLVATSVIGAVLLARGTSLPRSGPVATGASAAQRG